MAGRQQKKELIAEHDSLLDGTGTRTRETETLVAEEDLLARNLRKRAAIDHLDRMVTEKVAWKKAADMDFVEDELERIANKRQSERDSFITQRRPKDKEKPIKKESEAADSKLDARIDALFLRAKQAFRKTEGVFTLLKTRAGAAYIKIKMVTVAKYYVIQAKTAPLSAKLLVLREKEARFADRTAGAVGRLDCRLDAGHEKALVLAGVCGAKHTLLAAWTERHRKPLFAGFAAATAAAAALALLVSSMTAYEYMYNGKTLGVVKDQQEVYAIVDAIGNKLTYAYGAEVTIDKEENLSFKRVIGWNLKTDDPEEILDTFTYMSDMNANAYAITVDGKQVALLDTKATAKALLQTIKDKYSAKSDTVEYKSVGFAEDVKLVEVETKIKDIQSEEIALDYMLTGAVEKKVHVVQSGQTFGEIAKSYGLKSKELAAANPDVQPDKLQIGQELVLNQICPVLTVQTTEVATYNAKIDYDITYQETSTLYKGEQTVKSNGVNGQKKVVAEIVRENGIEVARTEISSEVLSAPVSQVVLKGTKPVPPLIGTGTYVYPVRGGTLSSRFGSRWGRMHYGIDLAAPTGTWIYASDGGTVISSGWESGLGKCIRISHGGNRVTVYGHCSKLLVSAGDKVFQGQHIGNVGSTGNSTGPHCHFEVRINGVAKNPLNYL